MNPWRRYNIFISSTFKDMDFERDVIKFRVIPELNRRFRDRRIELQAIDLRLGINTAQMTEEESERKVLSVCTSCIDSARPFFIGLIGQRYGWIPPLERWKEFISSLSEGDREILKNTAGCSVTEMEIVYGALSQESFDTSHILFYLRDNASYNGIPRDLLNTFCDVDPENIKRLEDLKKRVIELFGSRAEKDDRCSSYHLDWQDGHFSSDEFERLVTAQLAEQIESETASEDEAGTSSWWAGEKELEESTLLRLLPGSIDLGIYDDDEQNDDDDDSADMAVWYCQGLGASTRMAQEYAQWDGDDEVVRLLGVFGLSEYSTSMRPVIVRWIHEISSSIGRTRLPDDALMLGKMPETELFSLFEKLIKRIAKDKYIYIYLDDVEALETTSSKDLYMPWLDRIADEVNIMINLQDESEARQKFLEAHPNIKKKAVLGVEGDTEAAESLISNYEKLYYLELPEKIRNQMLDAASESSDNVLTPIKVHSIFRIFESLTQEDFREIRGRKGSQIDAINSYLEEIWSNMEDAPYDIMTFIVNTIAKNLSIGKKLRSAIWTIAAAPGGLRERDIAHFASEDWDEVQFHRAMNFLQDFFYEDHTRHLWRAKYITAPEDGLADRQREISEYILTLDVHDSLRETMGLYYALGGCEPSHFASYMISGDYLHAKNVGYYIRFYGPQVRQILREGFLDSDDFEKYCLALPASQRLQLTQDVLMALTDLPDELDRIYDRMVVWLDDIQYEGLSACDAYALAGFLGGRITSIPYLERAVEAARYCRDLGYDKEDRLFSKIATSLVSQYQLHGKNKKAEALSRELAACHKSVKERLTGLDAILASITKPSLTGIEREEGIDRFFEEYYSIVNTMEDSNENMRNLFESTSQMMCVFFLLLKMGLNERLLEEGIRFIPTMRRLYRIPNFFTSSPLLEKFVLFHELMSEATDSMGESYARLSDLALLAQAEGGHLLYEIDPDNKWFSKSDSRGETQIMIDVSQAIREDLEIQNVELKDIDGLIEKEYASLRSR